MNGNTPQSRRSWSQGSPPNVVALRPGSPAAKFKPVKIRYSFIERMDFFLIDHPRIVAAALIFSLAAIGALLAILVTR